MADLDLTLPEVWRTVQSFKQDLVENRQDTQRAIGKVESAVEAVRDAINNAPYVHQITYEERSKANGERVGQLEREVNDLKNSLRTVNAKAWGAVLTVVSATLVAALVFALGIK